MIELWAQYDGYEMRRIGRKVQCHVFVSIEPEESHGFTVYYKYRSAAEAAGRTRTRRRKKYMKRKAN